LAHQLSAGDDVVSGRVVRDAATLCKTDLTAELVKEFTELQGVIGGLYAEAQGLGTEVAQAIYEHYRPESMDAAAPRSREGAVVALADKADTVAGMFALGLAPSGSKDPFALRRAANGIVKIIAEHRLPVTLSQLIISALDGYNGSEAQKRFRPATETTEALRAFFRERLEFYLREVRGFSYDVVNAVLAVSADDVVDAVARAEAVAKVRATPDFEPISVSFKRMKNILRQAREAGKMPKGGAAFTRMEEAESELLEQSRAAANRVRELKGQRNYEQALVEIARLRPAVDRFFDKIMVMVEDDGLRGMRLALLERLVSEFSTIADFSEIVTEKAAEERR
jgi:glycyl-tRNA synthetase beta chain